MSRPGDAYINKWIYRDGTPTPLPFLNKEDGKLPFEK